MMNIVALCFVLSSLAAAGVWSPSPEKRNHNQDVKDVITEEVHRVVVIEFEKEDGDAKASQVSDKGYISDSREMLSKAAPAVEGVVEDAKEKLKDASSVLPNLGQGLSYPQDEQSGHTHSPCPKAHESGHTHSPCPKAHEDKVYEIKEEAKDAVSGALGKVRETVARKRHETSETAREAKEKAREAKETVGEVSHKAKETVSKKAQEVEEMAKETVEKAKRVAKEALDMSKTMVEDIEKNASKIMGMAKEKVTVKAEKAEEKAKHAAEKVKGTANRIKEKGNNIFHRARAVVHDVAAYVSSPETMESLMGVVHLLGFSTAYGTCVWVTFISSYVLAGALPRQQFGIVQSKICPVYFSAVAYGVGMALVGHLLRQRRRLFWSKVEMFEACSLLASLLLVVANLLYLEPRATKKRNHNQDVKDVITEEVHRVVVIEFEKEDGDAKASQVSDKGYISDSREMLSKAAPAVEGVVEDAKEKLKDASSVLPNLGQEIKYKNLYKILTNEISPKSLYVSSSLILSLLLVFTKLPIYKEFSGQISQGRGNTFKALSKLQPSAVKQSAGRPSIEVATRE
ncbi:unnamed protein product [Ilex paraguariensis]|uniref:TMEM205-like domain-containing protein n=1 Tax=Ilex paraguariensis TaxID=185542 RepID=A0ABC8V212_9AQUA